jgi:hypothetical protein
MIASFGNMTPLARVKFPKLAIMNQLADKESAAGTPISRFVTTHDKARLKSLPVGKDGQHTKRRHRHARNNHHQTAKRHRYPHNANLTLPADLPQPTADLMHCQPSELEAELHSFGD